MDRSRALAGWTSFVTPLEGAAAVRDLPDGGVATVARYLGAGPPDHAGLGRALRRLHETDAGAAAALDLLRLDDLDDVRAHLERLRADGVSAGWLDVLRRTADRLSGELAAVRGAPRVVHGDLHPPNILWTAGGAVLCDTDEIGLADPRWDLGFLVDPGRPDRLQGAGAREFFRGYAGGDGDPAVPTVDEARTFARAAHLRRTVRLLASHDRRDRVWNAVRVGAFRRMLARPELDLVPAVGRSRPEQLRLGLAALAARVTPRR